MANYTSIYTGQDLDYNIKLGKGSIAEEFNTSSTYSVGDIVIYSGDLYRCTIATIGAWNIDKWERAKISTKFARADGGNATGTWSITADKASCDSNGDAITTTYYKANNPNGYQTESQVVTIVNSAIGDAIAGSY